MHQAGEVAASGQKRCPNVVFLPALPTVSPVPAPCSTPIRRQRILFAACVLCLNHTQYSNESKVHSTRLSETASRPSRPRAKSWVVLMSCVAEIGAVNETSVVSGGSLVALPASASLAVAIPAAGESRSAIALTGSDGGAAATRGASAACVAASLRRRNCTNEFRSEWRVPDARWSVRSGLPWRTATRALGGGRDVAMTRSDQAM
jgi:hypothetical protein